MNKFIILDLLITLKYIQIYIKVDGKEGKGEG